MRDPENFEADLETAIREIRTSAKEVYAVMGPDMDDFVYEACLCKELHRRNLSFVRIKPLPVIYKNERIDDLLPRPSLIVEDSVFVEIDSMSMPHQYEGRVNQIFNYSKKSTVLFINFRVSGPDQMFKRMDMPKF